MITSKAKYALQALIQLGRRPAGTTVLIEDLAKDEGIPPKYLAQILHVLKMRGVLRSRKGRGGGYQLAKPAAEITVSEILRALDGPLAPVSCVSQTAYAPCRECSSEERCGIRSVMKEVLDSIAGILDQRTVADLVRRSAPADQEISYEI